MNSTLETDNLLPQIKAAVSTWENTCLKYRILPPEVIEPLRESRDNKSPILSDSEYLDLAIFLDCKAVSKWTRMVQKTFKLFEYT